MVIHENLHMCSISHLSVNRDLLDAEEAGLVAHDWVAVEHGRPAGGGAGVELHLAALPAAGVVPEVDRVGSCLRRGEFGQFAAAQGVQAVVLGAQREAGVLGVHALVLHEMHGVVAMVTMIVIVILVIVMVIMVIMFITVVVGVLRLGQVVRVQHGAGAVVHLLVVGVN